MLAWNEILIRLVLASVFGASIGLERARKDWAAGLRTHMMVCLGSCLIMIVSSFGFKDILGTANVELDPSRVAAQVVSGIGFIGAGAILFLKQGTVRGLTTAAGLWTVAAIGLATGGGMYFAAGATTVIALFILWALNPLEIIYTSRFRRMTLKIITHGDSNNTELINKILGHNALKILSFTIEKREEDLVFQVKFRNIEKAKIDAIVDELQHFPEIKEFFWAQ